MLIRPISDIHLEFDNFEQPSDKLFETIVPTLDEDNETILVVAGDLTSGNKLDRGITFLESMADRFNHVVYVTGNHEYYNSSIDKVDVSLLESIRKIKGVDLLVGGDSIILDKHLFVGGTLWTDYGKDVDAAQLATMCMNDYRMIEDFTVFDAYHMHLNHLLKIEDTLKLMHQSDVDIVVVTHHSPSFISCPPQFQKDTELNKAYHNDLNSLIMDYKPKLWIHGHTHSATQYNIGETKIVCNPRGYNSMYSLGSTGFDSKLVLEV